MVRTLTSYPIFFVYIEGDDGLLNSYMYIILEINIADKMLLLENNFYKIVVIIIKKLFIFVAERGKIAYR